MNEKLRNHINTLFADAPKTRQAIDLKDELLANLIERYNDLVESGVSEEDAYKNAIDNIGDVSELIRNLKENDILNYSQSEENRKKSALVLSISVALYFLGALALIYSSFFGLVLYGFLIMLGICAVATCLLVYHYASRPKYKKYDDTMVEEFKEWSSETKHYKGIRGAVSATLWTLITLVYLVISFATMSWYITWIIFIVGVCLESIITLIFKIKESHR